MRADIAIGWQNLLRCSLDCWNRRTSAKLEENGDAKIQYLKEIVDGQDIEVDTKTRLKDGSEYSVNYKLTFTPGGWRAYDVVVEGVSLVSNYRSQFDRFPSKKSFDELLQVLREKKS